MSGCSPGCPGFCERRSIVRRVSSDWNHNTHFHSRLLELLPPDAGTALDIGCGDGSFLALLAGRYPKVVGVDPDQDQVAASRTRCAGLPHVAVHQADFRTGQLTDNHFDVVTALATLHHMPLEDAANQAKRVLKPGGRLVVLGVWTDNENRRDLAWNLASVVLNRLLQYRRGPDSMTAPATLERTSWAETRAAASAHFPGARLRRHLLWRYTLVWDKPREA